MKTIIAGGRALGSAAQHEVEKAIQACPWSHTISEVVSGGAVGVDQAGERWARKRQIPIKLFLPDYSRHARKAPLLRNIEMADYAEALVAVWDGKSTGTAHMIKMAEKENLTIFVYRC